MLAFTDTPEPSPQPEEPSPQPEEPGPLGEVPEQLACEPGDLLCERVYDSTENEWLAVATNWLVAKPVHIVGLILVALVLRWVLHRLVDRLARRAAEGAVPGVVQRGRERRGRPVSTAVVYERRRQRARTMSSVLKSLVTGVLVAMFGIMIVDVLGYNVAPLIASAGIIGLAIGFGAQSLVTDFISGIFMILEDQYGVGDFIDVGEASGEVEAVGLRITRLRDINGTVWYVRNGEILRVGNMSQQWARTVLDVGVAYDQDLDRAKEVLREVAHKLWEDAHFRRLVLEEPEVWGVQELAAEAVLLRVVLKTAPMEQWGVARELRERIKERFDAEGIEIPLPQRVIWTRDDSAAPEVTLDGSPVTH